MNDDFGIPVMAAVEEQARSPGAAGSRATIVTKLAQAIGPSAGAMTDATEVATAVENEMHHKIPDMKEYNMKARSLVFNLRNNAELRARVISRSISAEDLVASSTKDLAPAQLQLQRQESANRFFATRQLGQSSEKVVGWQAGTSGKLAWSHKYETGTGTDGQKPAGSGLVSSGRGGGGHRGALGGDSRG